MSTDSFFRNPRFYFPWILTISLLLWSCEDLIRKDPVDPENDDLVLKSGSYLAVILTNSGVFLHWQDSSQHEDGYLIERALDSSGTFVEIGRTPRDSTLYVDSTTIQSFSAQYRVSPFVVKEAGIVTGPYVEGSVLLSIFFHRVPMTGVLSERKIRIDWEDLFSFETGFEIERRRGDSTFTTIGSAPANATWFLDEDAFYQNVLYTYRIRPLKGPVRGPASLGQSVRMFMTPPEGFFASINGEGDSVRLSWGHEKAEGYIVERDRGSGFKVIAELPSTVRNFLDTDFDTVAGVQRYRARTLISGPTNEWGIRRKPAFVREKIFEGHTDRITRVAFSPDGQFLLSGGIDRTVRVWGVASGLLERAIPLTTNVASLDVHPTLPWVIVAMEGSQFGNGGTDIYDYSTGTHVRRIGPSFYLAAFNEDGSLVGTGGEGIDGLVIETQTSDTVARLSVPHWEGGLYSLRFRPNSGEVLIGDRGGYVHVFDIETQAFLRSLKGFSDITSFALSPSGEKCVVPGSAGGGGASLFDASTAALLWTINTDLVRDVVFVPDGTILTASWWVNHASLWDPDAKALLMTATGHSDYVTCVAASPDAARVATGSADRTVRSWVKGMKWMADWTP